MKSRVVMWTSAISLLAALALPVWLSAQERQERGDQAHYRAFSLGVPLGGTVAGAAAINNFGVIAGDSNLTGDLSQHATLWVFGFPLDLGTLGGPNSAVLWPGLNERGEAVGISDTGMADPLNETWSCGAFFPASHAGHTCVGFAWQNGVMTPLPTLGGNNGFATSVNNHGQVVGWAENNVHDPTCVPPQVLQFEAVIWGPDNQIQRQLRPFPGDLDGAATGINDRGQVVGISGICQNAVGQLSAEHALLWQNGTPIDLGNLGGVAWNTPMAINSRGVVVGFSDLPGDQNGDNPNFHAFIWSPEDRKMHDLKTLPGDAISEALGINSRGQVVGVSYGAGFTHPHAVIWQKGKITDLNALLPPNSTLLLQAAQEIDDAGVIVGQAEDLTNGTSPAFVAVPSDDDQVATASITAQPNSKPATAMPSEAGGKAAQRLFFGRVLNPR